jgi:hypothetical protein
MGYLAVLFGVFVGGLVVTAVVLGLLSSWLFGTVQDWVLFGALGIAGLAAWYASDYYNSWTMCRATRR